MYILKLLVLTLCIIKGIKGKCGWYDVLCKETIPLPNETTSGGPEEKEESPKPTTVLIDNSLITSLKTESISDEVSKKTTPLITTQPNIIQEIDPVQTETEELDEKGCSINLFPELKNYFNNKEFSDFEIAIGEITIPVHQWLLSAKSPVLADKFKELIENYSLRYEIPEEDMPSFYEFIQFFYTESFPINRNSDQNVIKNVYTLAKKYSVTRLMTTIQNNFNKSFNLENFGEIFEFIFTENMTQTLDEWRVFVRKNSEKIFEKQLFVHNISHTMESIVYSMDLTESQKINIIKTINGLYRSDVNITRFKRLVDVPKCTAQELLEISEMEVLTKEDLLNKTIESLCQTKQELIDSKLNYERLRQTVDRNNQELRKCELQQRPTRNYPPYDISPQVHYSINRHIPRNQNNGQHIPRQINMGYFRA